jgi:gliding-associated putative ABC transporter substrate-binding component GldG
MADTSIKRRQQQRQALIRLFIMAAILLLLNVLAYNFNFNLDLTQEKRFTLSPATKNLLRNMKDVAVVDVYLKGDFPAGFKKLQEATRERLQSFKEYAGGHIIFHFIDPLEGKSEKEKEKTQEELAQKGIIGTVIQQNADQGYSEKVVFPWAIVHYYGRDMAVNLLENHFGMSAQQKLNTSESLLEYKLANAINKLAQPDAKRIAYVIGNNELLGPNTYDALISASRLYHVDTIDLREGIDIPLAYDAIIINKPTTPFDDKEKFKIDQYIMHGGRVLWLINQLSASNDSFKINNSQQFIAMDYGLNLDDILFKYGVRINQDLIEDMQSEVVPVNVKGLENSNGEPVWEMKPWIFFPVFIPTSNHPVVNNMGPVLGMYANSMDTIATPGIKKTILLQSSKYSRVENSPVRVSLSMTNFPMREDMFRSPYHPVAVLLEGKFSSVFHNRLPPAFLQLLRDSLKTPFKESCDTTNSMIVVSDGDIISNDYTQKGPYEMGYYMYSQANYANKSFYLNCLEYLTDHSGLLEARSKDLKLRLLDTGRVKDERLKWQIINIVLPVLLVLIFASGYIFFRKRRYERTI